MSLEESKKFGGFRVLELLKDDGGQADIYRAVCEEPTFDSVKVGDVVALKVMLVKDDDGRAYERLERRTEELVKMEHPNVVRYHGCFRLHGDYNDVHVVVLDYLKGQTLKERLQEQPRGMDVDDALRLIDAALAGLEHTSSKGIVHRDVKPGNIFICEDGQVKMIDFEIATRGGGTVTVSTNNLVGTFDYMAPEFTDSSFRGDTCSDVFSMGVVMHEALTGRTPYARVEGEDRQAGFAFHARWSNPEGETSGINLSKRIKAMLSHADEVVLGALACDREQRYADFTTFRQALTKIKNVTISSNGKAYDILQIIGKGGYGEVFKAREQKSGEVVAIKRLLGKHLGSKATVDRFLREARVMQKLQQGLHDSSFVEFKEIFHGDIGNSGVSYFIVMGYLEGMPGSSLRDAIKRNADGGLPTLDVLKAFARYSHGLSLMHGMGIVHRDIKPSNLHYSEWNIDACAIMDLGIARDEHGTQTWGGVPGTPDYMPPEIALTSTRGDSAMDIWALAICLYEALTGKTAYPRLSKKKAYEEFMKRMERGDRPRFEDPLLVEVPAIAKLLEEMTAWNPAKRLRDAALVERKLLSIAATLESDGEKSTILPVVVESGKKKEDAEGAPTINTIPQKTQLTRPPAPRPQVRIPVKMPPKPVSAVRSNRGNWLLYSVIGILVGLLGLGVFYIWHQEGRYKDRLEAAQKDAQEAQEAAKTAQEREQEAQKTAETAKKDAQAAKEIAETAQKREQDAKEKAKIAQQDLATMSDNLEKTQMDLNRSKQDLVVAQSAISSNKAEQASLQQRIKDLATSHEQKEKEWQERQNALLAMQKSVTNSAQMVVVAEELRKKAEIERDNLLVTNTLNEAKLSEAEAKISAMQKELKRVSGDAEKVKRLTSDIRKAEQDRKKIQDEMSATKNALDDVEKRWLKAETSRKEALAAAKTAKENMERAQAEARQAKDDLTKSENAKQQIENDLKSAQDKQKELEKSAKDAQDAKENAENAQKKAESDKKVAEEKALAAETAKTNAMAQAAAANTAMTNAVAQAAARYTDMTNAVARADAAIVAKKNAEERADAEKAARVNAEQERNKVEAENKELWERLKNIVEQQRKEEEKKKRKAEEEARKRQQQTDNLEFKCNQASSAFENEEWGNALKHWAAAVDLGWKMPPDLAEDVDRAFEKCKEEHNKEIARIDNIKINSNKRKKDVDDLLDQRREYHMKIKRSAGK